MDFPLTFRYHGGIMKPTYSGKEQTTMKKMIRIQIMAEGLLPVW